MVSRDGPKVRRAATHDAEAAIDVIIDSITRSCVDDHQNDPATLKQWLGNKTVAHFEQWLATPTNSIFVATLDSVVCGVALPREGGTINLCYVLPDMQRRGVGRALMDHVELEAKQRGMNQLQLMSSANARRFYEQLGYTRSGSATAAFGVVKGYPYTRAL